MNYSFPDTYHLSHLKEVNVVYCISLHCSNCESVCVCGLVVVLTQHPWMGPFTKSAEFACSRICNQADSFLVAFALTKYRCTSIVVSFALAHINKETLRCIRSFSPENPTHLHLFAVAMT